MILSNVLFLNRDHGNEITENSSPFFSNEEDRAKNTIACLERIVAIVSDSLAQVSTGIAQQLAITIAPLSVILDGQRCLDGIDLALTKLDRLMHLEKDVLTTKSRFFRNFHGGRGYSPFLGELLVLFPWGVAIKLASLAIGNPLRSPAIPLIVVMGLPMVSPSLNGSPIVLWLSAGMTVITIVKRLEANRRPLPADPIERRNVILRRIFLDRDIQDHKSWIRREPHQHN